MYKVTYTMVAPPPSLPPRSACRRPRSAGQMREEADVQAVAFLGDGRTVASERCNEIVRWS